MSHLCKTELCHVRHFDAWTKWPWPWPTEDMRQVRTLVQDAQASRARTRTSRTCWTIVSYRAVDSDAARQYILKGLVGDRTHQLSKQYLMPIRFRFRQIWAFFKLFLALRFKWLEEFKVGTVGCCSVVVFHAADLLQEPAKSLNNEQFDFPEIPPRKESSVPCDIAS